MSGELGVLYTSTNYTTNVNMGLVPVSLTEVHHDSNQVLGKRKKKRKKKLSISCGWQCTQKTYSSAAITVVFLEMLEPTHYP